jgi:hypothetical protein
VKHTLPHRAPVAGWYGTSGAVDRNAEQLELDCRFLERSWSGRAGLAVVGPLERLFVDPSARVDPMVVADTTRGAVVIDRGAVVTAFTRLEGPCSVGPHAQLLGAKVRGGTALGPLPSAAGRHASLQG